MRKTITTTEQAHKLLTAYQAEHKLKSLSDAIIHLHKYQQDPTEQAHNQALDNIIQSIHANYDNLTQTRTQAEIMLTYIRDKNLDQLEDEFPTFFEMHSLIVDDTLTPTYLNNILKHGYISDPYDRKKCKQHAYDNSKITTDIQLEGFTTRGDQLLKN